MVLKNKPNFWVLQHILFHRTFAVEFQSYRKTRL